MEAMLSIEDVAGLTGKTPRYIRMLAKDGKLPCQVVRNELNRDKYLIPLSGLDASYQLKYIEQQTPPEVVELARKLAPGGGAPKKPLDHYSAEEREEIAFWIRLVAEWEDFRKRPGANKTQVDEEFAALCRLRYPERGVSIDTLYRRRRAIREDNLDGLVDQRGSWKKGKHAMPETVWQIYLSFYLDQSQYPQKKCYEYTQMWVRQDFPELYDSIPDYSTFTRRVKNEIPKPLEDMGRYGNKAFEDRSGPYIRRVYEDMESNEWWVADNHTFDVIVQDTDGKQHRLYLTAFFDARSGIFTGCYVTTAPSSQSTLIALRKGILKYGIPENIYVDNGREFLTFDIGGLGHRKKKPKDGQAVFEVPPVFERLGIKMTNALVRNAKAKIIERRFRDVKDGLSRLFETYTGGNVLEKPERLKKVLKKGEIPTDAQFTEIVEELLDWYFNQQPYGGEVIADRGKPRQQVYNENLHTKRVAGEAELNLMLMRSSRVQTVGKRGVHLPIGGQRLDYWNDELLYHYQGKQVYFRYDPEDLSKVRVYDLEDRYIMNVPVDNTAVLSYNASQEEVKAAMAKTRKLGKITKEALKASAYPAFGKKTALELMLAEAAENKKARAVPESNPRVIELQRADEEPLLKAVNGPDLDLMYRNALKRKGGNEDE